MTKIIADACCNHMGDSDIIHHMIKRAAEVGVDYIKFQAYDVEYLNTTIKYWDDKLSYYRKHQLKDNDYHNIIYDCNKYNIKPMFTVFHESMVPKLLTIGVDTVKIASPDMFNIKLLKACKQFKHVFVSTGMHGNTEIKLVRKLYDNYIYLYCVSKYPAKHKDIDFNTMQLFDGFSDHTISIDTAKKAIDLGTGFIERHYTLGKDLPGNDHLFSSTPDEFRELVEHKNYIKKVGLYMCRWKNGKDDKKDKEDDWEVVYE